MNYTILQQLINYLDVYETNHKSVEKSNLNDFVVFLNQELFEKKQLLIDENDQHETIERVLSRLIAFLYRYAKGYIKKALQNSTLLTLDDFSYLAGIWKAGSCTKTEIIEKNIHEKTTGIEIIKRLLNAELIYQTDDTTDRRSKRLMITEKGKETLFGVFEDMRKASIIIAGNLSTTEKMQLAFLLQKLDYFHNPLFLEQQDKDLDSLLVLMGGDV